jgi:tRNA pseudouridine-54 N-methylase
MKRRFIVVASGLEDLASQTPLLARCVSAALMVSHGLRRDSDLVLAVAGGPLHPLPSAEAEERVAG